MWFYVEFYYMIPSMLCMDELVHDDNNQEYGDMGDKRINFRINMVLCFLKNSTSKYILKHHLLI